MPLIYFDNFQIARFGSLQQRLHLQVKAENLRRRLIPFCIVGTLLFLYH